MYNSAYLKRPDPPSLAFWVKGHNTLGVVIKGPREPLVTTNAGPLSHDVRTTELKPKYLMPL